MFSPLMLSMCYLHHVGLEAGLTGSWRSLLSGLARWLSHQEWLLQMGMLAGVTPCGSYSADGLAHAGCVCRAACMAFISLQASYSKSSGLLLTSLFFREGSARSGGAFQSANITHGSA